MELTDLRLLVEIADTPSVSKAAERLHTSQPAASRRLQALEAELSTVLVRRSTREASLTPSGEALVARAREILELAETARLEAGSARRDAHALSIGAAEGAGMALVARAIASIRPALPGLVVDIISGNAEELEERLDAGVFDLCVLVGPVDLSRFESVELPVRDRWGLICRRDDPMAARATVGPAEIAGIPLMSNRRTMIGDALNAWMGPLRRKLKIVATVNLVNNGAQLVRAGDCRGLCLEGVAPADLAFVPLDPPLEVPFYLVFRKQSRLSPAALALVEALGREARTVREAKGSN